MSVRYKLVPISGGVNPLACWEAILDEAIEVDPSWFAPSSRLNPAKKLLRLNVSSLLHPLSQLSLMIVT